MEVLAGRANPLPAQVDGLLVDREGGAKAGTEEREPDQGGSPAAASEVGHQRREEQIRVGEERVEQDPADIGAELLVEELLEPEVESPIATPSRTSTGKVLPALSRGAIALWRGGVTARRIWGTRLWSSAQRLLVVVRGL